VVRPMGNLNPELVRAVVTRSLDSFTAASGRPTMTTIAGYRLALMMNPAATPDLPYPPKWGWQMPSEMRKVGDIFVERDHETTQLLGKQRIGSTKCNTGIIFVSTK
jgi:hypothetical protein